MTKLGYFTDLHLRSVSPIGRKDSFKEAVLTKFENIIDIFLCEGVDAIVFGGDFFHTYRVYDYDLLRRVICILETVAFSDIPFYTIVGQHDLAGYDPDSLSKSAFQFVISCSTIQVLREPVIVGDVEIRPCHVYDDLVVRAKEKSKSSTSILIAHKLISKITRMFDVFITSDLNTENQLVLSGDLHAGVPLHEINGTQFFNPGAVARLSRDETDMKRKPQIAVIECEKGGKIDVRPIFIPGVSSPDEVFKLDEDIPIMLENTSIAGDFIEQVRNLEKRVTDVFELVKKVGEKMGANEDVMNYIESKRAELQIDNPAELVSDAE